MAVGIRSALLGDLSIEFLRLCVLDSENDLGNGQKHVVALGYILCVWANTSGPRRLEMVSLNDVSGDDHNVLATARLFYAFCSSDHSQDSRENVS